MRRWTATSRTFERQQRERERERERGRERERERSGSLEKFHIVLAATACRSCYAQQPIETLKKLRLPSWFVGRLGAVEPETAPGASRSASRCLCNTHPYGNWPRLQHMALARSCHGFCDPHDDNQVRRARATRSRAEGKLLS